MQYVMALLEPSESCPLCIAHAGKVPDMKAHVNTPKRQLLRAEETGSRVVFSHAVVHIVTSEDGTSWTDGIDPTSASDQASKIVSAPVAPGGLIQTTANATIYYFPPFSISEALGYMPSFWSVVVKHTSGATLDSTAANFSAKHSLISFA